MRVGVVIVAVGILAGASASLGYAVLGDRPASHTVAELEIEPTASGGPRGTGLLVYRDGRLSGRIVVWGLEPGARYAVHFHGPDSACGTKADAVAAHDDLEADAEGVAAVRVDVATPTNVLGPGFYYNVHAEPSTVVDNPEIACGNLRPLR